MNTAVATVAPSLFAENTARTGSSLSVHDLCMYLKSLHEEGMKFNTVDRIIIGDHSMEITKIGTCWMPYWKTLKEAVNKGVNTIVVHEPTFYTHYDLNDIADTFSKYPAAGKHAYMEQIEKKKQWIEENQMAIIRCHDVWDIFPKTGIPFAFGMTIGFTNDNIIRSLPYFNVYAIEPAPANEVAKRIASCLKRFNQPGVAFYGDQSRIVRSVGLGTGCICNPINYMELEADLYIAIDDSVSTWIQTTYAEDTGHPLVVVNHGTSEEYGMVMLNSHLKNTFPSMNVIHFGQGCGYNWITG